MTPERSEELKSLVRVLNALREQVDTALTTLTEIKDAETDDDESDADALEALEGACDELDAASERIGDTIDAITEARA